MWHGLWPDRGGAAVPIGHVTNGVHEPTWLGDPMRALLDRHLGRRLARAAAATRGSGPAVARIAAAELWAARARAARRA